MNPEIFQAILNNRNSRPLEYWAAKFFGAKKVIVERIGVSTISYWKEQPYLTDFRPERHNPTGQSKAASMVEAIANILVGVGVAFAANMVVLPLYGYQVQPHEAAGMTGIFTAISFARSYALRRVFNWMQIKEANQ